MGTKASYKLPIVCMLLYLIFTLILYDIGPLDWITYKPLLFWGLQILYIFMLTFGWHIGINETYTRNDEWTVQQEQKVLSKLPKLMLINLGYEFVNIFRKFMLTSFDIGFLISKIMYGFTDMGASYNLLQQSIETIAGSSVVGGTLVTLFNYVWEFFAFGVLLMATYYYKKLPNKYKIVLIITYIIIISSYVGTGTNIGVFRLVLSWIIFPLTKLIRYENIIDKSKLNKRRLNKRKKYIILGAIVAVVVCTIFFDLTMKSRGGILLWETSDYNIGGIGIDRDSILFKILPQSLCMLLISATAYLTQGYYGMSLCLKVNWEPTFGLGHSMAIEKLLNEYVIDWPYLRTYQHRIQLYGWDENVQWHSAYSWFANDVGFIGVAIITFIYGLLFAMAYKDAIKTDNPFSCLMVYYFTLEAFFLPCNNQLFQSTYVMFSFFTVLTMWLCTRGRKKLE